MSTFTNGGYLKSDVEVTTTAQVGEWFIRADTAANFRDMLDKLNEQ